VVPDRFIDEIRFCIDENGFIKFDPSWSRFKKGDRVEISDGHFFRLSGNIFRKTQGKR